MKLQTKTNLLYLVFSIPILLLAGVVCYYLITYEVRDSNDELLLNRKAQIEKLLNRDDQPALNLITLSGEAAIAQIKEIHHEQPYFTDTLIFDNKEGEPAPNRMLVANVQTERGAFQIKVWRSTIEFDELFEGIMLTILLILVLFFAALLVVNNWVRKTLWKPFYAIVDFISGFSFNENKKFTPLKTSVREFNELNQSFSFLIDKVNRDYASQKQFTENASHEMQTPLAVINSKIDLLIQSPNLSQSDTELIVAVDDAVSKLIRLDKALLLLTKIENRQFSIEKDVSIERIIEYSLSLFQDHLQSRNINLDKTYFSSPKLNINADLCAVLVSNLMQNAIRHNQINGEIVIELNAHQLIIANSGESLPFEADKIFNRFQKGQSSTDSIGLGLAIAKAIADAFNFSLSYRFDHSLHYFTLEFGQR